MKITINLLPTKEKNILRAKYIFRIILEQQFLILTVLVLITLGLLTTNYILKLQRDSFLTTNEGLVQRADYAEILDLHKSFAKTNAQIETISALQTYHIKWDDIFTLLTKSIPTDITVSEIRTENDRVSLIGVAQRVDSLVAFQNSLSETKLDEHECFWNVDVPDEYLVKSEDVNFIMTFQLNVNECMKEKYE